METPLREFSGFWKVVEKAKLRGISRDKFRGKNGQFREKFKEIFRTNFAEKWLVKHGNFLRKFCLKAIGFAVIWQAFLTKKRQ